MTRTLVYICEDDPHLGLATQALLQSEGYDCMLFNDAEELDAQCSQLLPQLLLLDNELPGESGFSIARRYNATAPGIRIIMMSVLKQKQHLADGYEAGAMLYLPKPFEPEALIACLRGIFGEPSLQPSLILNMQSLQLQYEQGAIVLTTGEAKLLLCLSIHSPAVVEYFEIMEAIGLDTEVNKKTRLEVIVSRIRKKLKPIAAELQIINKQSLGYALSQPIHILQDITQS